jgi:cobalt transporter subunit CbtA
MIARALRTVLLSGVVAGLAVTAAQSISVVPLIVAAETYELHDHSSDLGTDLAEGSEHIQNPNEPHNASGDNSGRAADDVAVSSEVVGGTVARTAVSALANVLIGIGFGLLLVAAYIVTGLGVGWKRGALWGMAGFGVFSVAPALGLPPELPGMPAADLVARQIWWLGTVGATGLGLYWVVFVSGPIKKIAGLALLIVPHLIGAPMPLVIESSVPAALAAEFVVASLATAAFFWATLGAVTGWLFDRGRMGPAKTN